VLIRPGHRRNNLTDNERQNYLNALDSIQTGDISLHSDTTEDEKDAVMAAVRLINGSVKHDSRQNLMLGVCAVESIPTAKAPQQSIFLFFFVA